MSATFQHELEEIKIQEQIEIQKILDDPKTSPELKKVILESNQEPSWHRPMFSIEQMMEVEDPELRDKNMPSPENVLDQKERDFGIEKLLETLTARECLVIEKTFWENKSQKEIVAETEIPQQTVSWILQRAFQKMANNPLSMELWDESTNRTYPKGSERDLGSE